MFSKRLPRRKTAHTMQIGDAVRVHVAALTREDDQCPNNIELTIADPGGGPPIVIRLESLSGMNPTISIDAPREIPISHESCGILPNGD